MITVKNSVFLKGCMAILLIILPGMILSQENGFERIIDVKDPDKFRQLGS